LDVPEDNTFLEARSFARGGVDAVIAVASRTPSPMSVVSPSLLSDDPLARSRQL